MGNARPAKVVNSGVFDQAANVPTIETPFMPQSGKLAATVFGYGYKDPRRREWMRDAVLVVLHRARRARAAVAREIIAAGYRDTSLAEMIEEHLLRDDRRGLKRPAVRRPAPTQRELLGEDLRAARAAIGRAVRHLPFA